MTLWASGSGIIDVIQKEVLIVLRLAVPAWEVFLISKEITDVEGMLDVHILEGSRFIINSECCSIHKEFKYKQGGTLLNHMLKYTESPFHARSPTPTLGNTDHTFFGKAGLVYWNLTLPMFVLKLRNFCMIFPRDRLAKEWHYMERPWV